MTDKSEKNQIEPTSDPMMDTQWLLGAGPPAEGNFELEEILEEFGEAASSAQETPSPAAEAVDQELAEGAAPPEPVPEAPPPEPSPPASTPPEEPPPRRKWWFRNRPAQPAQEAAAAPPESAADLPETPESPPETPPAADEQTVTEEMLDKAFFADMVPNTAPDGTPEEPPANAPETAKMPPEEAVEAVVKETVKEAMGEASPQETSPQEATPQETAPQKAAPPESTEAPSPPSAKADSGEPSGLPPVSMEAIENLMADTVDAVKEEQEQRQERLRKQLEKAKKAVSRSFSKKEKPLRHPMPDAENEPPPTERAMWHKRRARDSRKSMRLATLATALLWLPWMLTQFGVTVPFFSESAGNAALCVLIPQAIATVISWPVFRAALEHLREGMWSMYATAALCTLVTLLDEMTLLLLPKRVDAAPLGGLACVLLVFMLWGLSGLHRGLSDSLRTMAMGEPTHVVDRCGAAVAKGKGGRKGFFTRISMEDTPSQWQRLLLPLLAAASLIFALLSSAGQGQPQNFLWCWSVILCSATSLVFPLAYCVPFGRLAVRLARSGAAIAGQYGASILASTRRLAVTDEDLFPQNTASLGGLKLYGEERNKAVSYAATLAVRAGGNLGRIFGTVCQNERINYQSLEHFHIHDDGGLSGIICGETVLVGSPAFMRHKAVRLPGSMPAKTCVCMAVDNQLAAVFIMKYNPNDTVEYALRSIRRNGLQITLAVRDSNISPKLLKERFGVSGNVQYPELGERLTLSDPERDAEEPNALMYREGLLPLASLAVGSSRLCQTALVGNLLSIFSSIAGALLGFYLTFTGSYAVLTPPLLLTYMLLWVMPVLLLVWTVDKL